MRVMEILDLPAARRQPTALPGSGGLRMERISLDRFIPCTQEREIAKDVVYRPIRSWHSNTYAGERLTAIPGSQDSSGCLFREMLMGVSVCRPPITVTHRMYWHRKSPDRFASAFLSYPNGMGACDSYFWEISLPDDDDVQRFFGPKAEQEMETVIVHSLTQTSSESRLRQGAPDGSPPQADPNDA